MNDCDNWWQHWLRVQMRLEYANSGKDYLEVIAYRKREKANVAKKNLKQETRNPHIYALELNLASHEFVRKFYKAFAMVSSLCMLLSVMPAYMGVA